MEEESRPWRELPREILAEVFCRLGFEDRYKAVRLVCKTWSSAAKDSACWGVADLEESFQRRAGGGSWWSDEFEGRIDAMVKNAVDWSCGAMRELNSWHCSDAAVVYAAMRCPRLVSLSVKDSPNLTDVAGAAIANSCLELRRLDLSGSINISLQVFESGKCRSLVDLRQNLRRRIHAAPQFHSLGAMPELQTLELRNHALSDTCLEAIIRGCPKLRHLDLLGCEGFSNATVDALEKLVEIVLRPPPRLDEIVRYGHWQLYSERFQSAFQF